MSAIGYVVKHADGTLDVKTVSESARAAKVNGLFIAGHAVMQNCPDHIIGEAFECLLPNDVVVMVYIVERKL